MGLCRQETMAYMAKKTFTRKELAVCRKAFGRTAAYELINRHSDSVKTARVHIGVGAQSTLGGGAQNFCPKNLYKNHQNAQILNDSCPRKIIIIPDFL